MGGIDFIPCLLHFFVIDTWERSQRDNFHEANDNCLILDSVVRCKEMPGNSVR